MKPLTPERKYSSPTLDSDCHQEASYLRHSLNSKIKTKLQLMKGGGREWLLLRAGECEGGADLVSESVPFIQIEVCEKDTEDIRCPLALLEI